MTTARSPISTIKRQAAAIAAALKAAERGEYPDVRFIDKLKAARAKDVVKFAVAMDDKIISIEMSWALIRDSSEAGLIEYIVRLMRGQWELMQ